MLRLRPIRARIYQPILRFGVVAGDWKYILAISVICYVGPMVLRMSLGSVPLCLVAAPVALFLSYSFFYWSRVGKEPGWLQHQWRALIGCEIERGTLPADRAKNPAHAPHAWMK